MKVQTFLFVEIARPLRVFLVFFLIGPPIAMKLTKSFSNCLFEENVFCHHLNVFALIKNTYTISR